MACEDNADDLSLEIIHLLESAAEKCKELDDDSDLSKLLNDVKHLKDLIRVSLQPLVLNIRKENEVLVSESASIREEVTSLRSELATTKSELEKVKKQCASAKKTSGELRKKQSSFEATMKILREDNVSCIERLSQQSAYCVSLGAVMGTLFWKCTSVSQVIQLLSSAEKTKEFLHLTAITLRTFLLSCPDAFPAEDSQEVLFISALLGTIANLATSEEGCRLLTSATCIDPIMEHLPAVYLKAGESLRSTVIMLLYNISLNENGSKSIMKFNECTLQLMAAAIKLEKNVHSQMMSLLTLGIIMQNIDNVHSCRTLLETIPRSELEKFKYNSQDSHFQKTLSSILQIYQQIQTKFASPSTNLLF